MKTPFYTAFLGFIIYQNGLSGYILLSDGLTLGSRIFNGSFLNNKNLLETKGYSLPLRNANLFSVVSNVELNIFKGGSLSRAAGTGLILTSKLGESVLLKSKSG